MIEGLIQNKNFLAANALANGLNIARGYNIDLLEVIPTLPNLISQLKSTIQQKKFKDLNQGIPDPYTLFACAAQISATIEEAHDRFIVAQQKLHCLQLCNV